MRDKVAIAVLVVLVIAALGVAYGYREEQQCNQREKAYKARIAQLEADAKKIPVGAPKQAVEEFFKQHELRASFHSSNGRNYAQAMITQIKACSPGWYCGDEALIEVRFDLDKDWRVVSSYVGGGYTNCL